MSIYLHVYRQTVRPAHKVGRIWVDTANNNVYRSDGLSWQQITSNDALELLNGPAEAGADVTANIIEPKVKNPGFEAGDVYWTKTGGATIQNDPANARKGNWVGKIFNTGKFINTHEFPVGQNDRVIARAWFKGGTAGSGRVGIEWIDSSGVVLTQSSGDLIAFGGTTYQKSRVIASAPANTAHARIIAETTGSPTGTWYVDQIRINEVLRDDDIDALLTTNAPAVAGATKNTLTSGTATPTGGTNGDLYYETDAKAWWANIAGAWSKVSDETAANLANAADIYVLNHKFELGDLFWTKSAGVTIINSPANARRGDWCAQMVGDGVNFKTLENDARVPVGPGDRVTAKAWFKGGTAGTAFVSIRWKDASDNFISSSQGDLVASGASYARSRSVAIAPSGAVQCDLMAVLNTTATGTWYCDDCRVVEVLQDADIDALLTTNAPAEAGADVTANHADILILNPNFEAGDVDWVDSTGDSAWTIVNDPTNAYKGNWVLKYTGTNANSFEEAFSSAFAVSPGENIRARCQIKSASGTTGSLAVVIVWRDASLGFLSASAGDVITGPQTTYVRSRITTIVPSGAAFANIGVKTVSAPSGTWYVDQFRAKFLLDDTAGLPQGSYDNLIVNPGAEASADLAPHNKIDAGGAWSVSATSPRSGARCFRYAVAGQTANAQLDLNGVATLGANAHVAAAEGDQFYAEVYARKDNNAATARLRSEYYDETGAQLAANGVSLAMTTTYQRIEHITTAPAGTAYVVFGLQVTNGATGNVRFDDIYARRVLQTESISAVLSAGISGTFSVRPITNSTDVGATATINMAATTLSVGGRSVSYGSASITGLAFSTKYYVYRDDPDLNGSGTWTATTTLTNATGVQGRIFGGQHTTVADGGGTGGTNADPAVCVAADQFIGPDRRAVNARRGTALDVLLDDPTMSGYRRARIEGVDAGVAECVELVTRSGIRLVCSKTTPLTLRDGSTINVLAGKGREVPVLDFSEMRWEALVDILPAGVRHVAHIHVGGRTYAAGAEPGRSIFTHNAIKP